MAKNEKFIRLIYLVQFWIVYMIIFSMMENRNVEINIIHTALDDAIPFCKYFIIPYMLWFVFVGGTVFWIGFIKDDREEYNRLILNLGFGIVMFIITSLIYPNGQDLRPVVQGNDIFANAVRFLYSIDTPTNILPSLHVYNSIVCLVAISRACDRKNKYAVKFFFQILTVSIILATMCLKQHSVVDVATGLLLNMFGYEIAYGNVLTEVQLGKESRRVGQL
ncbi:MAG: phosphatase PAP2 family protein [Lachnospiraceae bacterium]|nr:phosphatase PAP2 family protein [Lachnospiraceae bacterium]